MPKLKLTSGEKNASRVVGAMIGIAAIAALLWLNRPVDRPPTMGTAAAVSVSAMDGIFPQRSFSEVFLSAHDLRVGGHAGHGALALESHLDRPVEMGFTLDKAGRATVARDPAARAVHIAIGRGGRLGEGSLASFAASPRRVVRLGSRERLEVPVAAWIPGRFGYRAVGLELDLTLQPAVIGEAG